MSDTFKAITWNVYHGTAVKELEPILKRQLKKGVSLLLMQEAGGRDITGMLRDNGLKSFTAPRQYVVAWDPELWVKAHAEKVRLSDQPYYAKGGDKEQYSDAARVILCDREGRSLETVSYHTPAGVQKQEKNRPERRYIALVESMQTLGHMADDFPGTAVLYGGDDNWDENTGLQTPDVKPYLLGEATGLRQLQAPGATHGRNAPRRGRQIDDFRIKRGGGIRPVGKGWTADGGGDHRIHGREFRWR